MEELIENSGRVRRTIEEKRLAPVLESISGYIQQDFLTLTLIPEITASHVKRHLNMLYRGIVKQIVRSLGIRDFVSFSNEFAQLCAFRDRLRNFLLTSVPSLPFYFADLLDFLAADFAALYEERAQELLHGLLQNEISVFLEMMSSYLETYKLPPLSLPEDKYAGQLASVDSGKTREKKLVPADSMAMSKARTEASVETKKGLRESYLKVYPSSGQQVEKREKRKESSSRTSFKTVSIGHSFHSPGFLLHEKSKWAAGMVLDVRYEFPHKISFFTHKTIQLFDKVFESVLADTFAFTKLQNEFFSSLLWYITSLQSIVSPFSNMT